MPVQRSKVRLVSCSLVGAAATVAAMTAASTASADPLPGECSQSGNNVTCTYTQVGRYSIFTTPVGVSTLRVVVSGAAGGDGSAFTDAGGATGAGGIGSAGQRVTSTLQVSAGAVLDVAASEVGEDAHPGTVGASYYRGGYGGVGDGSGGPGSYYNDGAGASGGGGGASSISGPLGQLVVAGGGGGGGGGGTAGRTGGNGQGLGPRVSGSGGGPGGYESTDQGGGGGGGGGFAGGAGGDRGAGAGDPGQGGYSGRNLAPAGSAIGLGTPGAGGVVTISYTIPGSSPSSGTKPGGSTTAPAERGVDLADGLTGPATLKVGQAGTITLKVTNNGDNTASAVRTTVVLPPGLVTTDGARAGALQYDVASLAPGQAQTVPISVTGVRAKAKAHVTATSKSGTPDANNRDNRSDISITVTR